MKKQYRCQDTYRFGVYVELYHDGELVERKNFWEDDKYLDYLDNLEASGYVYGYTKEEVEECKQRYEYMLANII